jgi:hypothetical protein
MKQLCRLGSIPVATTSFPVPRSPRIITVMFVWATWSMSLRSFSAGSLQPMIGGL